SRRRHTRSKRDWSSDVCSSDLTGEIIMNAFINKHYDSITKVIICMLVLTFIACIPDAMASGGGDLPFTSTLQKIVDALSGTIARSEERRVGKEGEYGSGGERYG